MEIPMFLLSIVWLALFIVELVKGLTRAQEIVIYIIWGIFIFEYLLKLFLAPRKLGYIRQNWITLIALIVPALRVLRIFYALRLLQSARFLSSTKIIRALTSGKRFVSELKEAQGLAPEPEMHAGILIASGKTGNNESLKNFCKRMAADAEPELQSATGINWHFHYPEPVKLQHDKPHLPSDFLDDAARAMAEGPYDTVIVVTDVPLTSRKKRIEPGLASPTSRVAVISAAKLTQTGRESANLQLEDAQVRWNAAKLLLHLLGHIMGLSHRKHARSAVMKPFEFSRNLQTLPQFNAEERKHLQKRRERLPERELKEGNVLESLVFHILMAFRHPKELLLPLLRNGSLLLPLSLPGLATAAVAPSFLLVFTAEIWDVGLNMSNITAGVFAVVSIVGASLYLVQAQSLFLPRKEKKILTEHLAVANSVIYFSMLMASIGLFLMVGALMMVIEIYVFPPDLMQTWPTLDKPAISLGDQLRLATFISTVGVITGALAGGFESRTVIRHLALFEKEV